MKSRFIFIFIFIALTTVSNAQSIDSNLLKKQEIRMTYLEKQISDIRVENNALQQDLSNLEQKTNELCMKLNATDSTISYVDKSYGTQLQQTNTTVQANHDKQQKSVQWGIVLAIFLVVITIVVYLILRKKIAKKGDDIEKLRIRADEINQQMVMRMDKELVELQKITSAATTPVASTSSNDAEPDHSLVKALAYSITRIEYNLQFISPTTKGYKPLQIALRKMKDNLRANNYEIVDMMGQEYNEGMTLDEVAFIDNPNMEKDKQIITRVIQPQINYCGKAIQYANIEVSR